MSRVVRAVSRLLAHARGDEAASVLGLVPAIERMRSRPLLVRRNENLAPGVFAVWRSYADRDEVHHAPWVASLDRTIGHEFGHILMGHDGVRAPDLVEQTLPAEWRDMANFMLHRECGQGVFSDKNLRRIEAEAEAFASELCRRIAGAGSARSARIRSLLNEAL